MARRSGREGVYQAAQLLKQRCFVDHTSYLWPEVAAWSLESINQLGSAMFDHPDEGPGTFLDKLRKQLADYGPNVHRIAADLMVLYELFPDRIGANAKLAAVNSVISSKLIDDPPQMDLSALFAQGIGSTGPHYVGAQYFAFLFYLDFARTALTEGININDPVEAERVADDVQARREQASEARNILLHLFFPDEYELIVGMGQKRQLRKKYSEEAAGETNLDAALRSVRKALTPRFGDNFDWYDPVVQPEWNPPSASSLSEQAGSPAAAVDLVADGSADRAPRVWIEKSAVQGRPDRLSGADAVGSALWSPQRSKTGADIYRFMRDVRPGDTILHLTDSKAFTGRSVVEETVREFEARAGTAWDGPGYRVQLGGYEELDPSLDRDAFFNEPYATQLRELSPNPPIR